MAITQKVFSPARYPPQRNTASVRKIWFITNVMLWAICKVKHRQNWCSFWLQTLVVTFLKTYQLEADSEREIPAKYDDVVRGRYQRRWGALRWRQRWNKQWRHFDHHHSATSTKFAVSWYIVIKNLIYNRPSFFQNHSSSHDVTIALQIVTKLSKWWFTSWSKSLLLKCIVYSS